jgi:hypothetical protein
MYNFLEGSDRPNPFHDAGAAPQPGRIPTLTLMSEPEAAGANQDTPAELRDGAEMRARRRAFLERVAQGEGPPARAGKAEKAAQAAQARAAAAAAKGAPFICVRASEPALANARTMQSLRHRRRNARPRRRSSRLRTRIRVSPR